MAHIATPGRVAHLTKPLGARLHQPELDAAARDATIDD